MKMFPTSNFDKSTDCELKRSIFEDNIPDMADLVESWTGYEEIAKKLRRIGETFQERCEKCIAPRIGEVKVLNHGDLWVNNCLFKYKNGVPVKLMLVSFLRRTVI